MPNGIDYGRVRNAGERRDLLALREKQLVLLEVDDFRMKLFLPNHTFAMLYSPLLSFSTQPSIRSQFTRNVVWFLLIQSTAI